MPAVWRAGARWTIAFGWAPTDPGRVFSVAGNYRFNGLEVSRDIDDLLRALRKAALVELSSPGGSDQET